MSVRRLPVTAILAAGVGMGIAGDFLFRSSGEPGLNFSILFAGLAGSVAIVSASGGPQLSREARIWLALGVLFGAGMLWRGSEFLRFLAFVAGATAFALPALRAGQAWVLSASVGDVIEAGAGAGLNAATGSIRLLQRRQWEAVGGETARSAARSVLIGVLVAIVPLLVFGGLFLSADRVFAGIVDRIFGIDLQVLASHVALTGVLPWLACGYLAGFTSGTRLDGLREVGWVRPSLRTAEVAVALALVDLLFLAFVIVQFRYLFGGRALVDVTPGLTYAAYAREGFFQLVAATALGLPWLLAADALFDERDVSGRWIFRTLAGAQLLLLLAIVASAVQRMRVYLDTYGLTEDRVVAMAVLGWLALLIVYFAATVLRNRSRSFPFGALASGFALVVLLQFIDPAGWAARSQLDRAAESDRAGVASALDVSYLASLGSDAAPVLLQRLDELGETGRCVVARSLLRRWGPERETDWRSWNRADRRAREAVSGNAARLQAMAGTEVCKAAPGSASAAAPVESAPGVSDTTEMSGATGDG